MRRKLTDANSVSRSVVFPVELYDHLSDAAERLGTTVSEVIRECCTNDLLKLIKRENNRQTRKTNIRL